MDPPSPFIHLVDETMPESFSNTTADLSYLSLQTPVPIRVMVNESEEKDGLPDLEKASSQSFNFQESSAPTPLGNTLSINGSSSSRTSPEATHDLKSLSLIGSCGHGSSLEATNDLESLSLNGTRGPAEAAGSAESAVVQNSGGDLSRVTEANVTHVIWSHGDVGDGSASGTALLSSSASGVALDPECDAKRVDSKNCTFDLEVERATQEPETGPNRTPVRTLPNVTITEFPITDVKTVSPLNNTEPQASAEPEKPLSNTFEAQPGETETSGVHSSEDKAQSQPSPSTRGGLSYSLCDQSVCLENNKRVTFSLDDPLVFSSSSLVSSTPVPDSKAFYLGMERKAAGKIPEVRKALCLGALPKPTTQPPAASNIVTDRKTFLKPPSASNPRSVVPVQRPASLLPSLAGPPSSTLLGARMKTRAEALRNASLVASQEASSSGGTQRNAIPESKTLLSGLRKPQPSGLPSASLRSNLRPLGGRAAVTSSGDKPGGPAANVNPKARIIQAPSQAQKHLPTISEALPGAKRKKMDVPAPSTCSVASSCSAMPAKGARGIKRPATTQKTLPPSKQMRGCSNCQLLIQQEREKCQELERCQQELKMCRQELKKSRQENERLQAGITQI